MKVLQKTMLIATTAGVIIGGIGYSDHVAKASKVPYDTNKSIEQNNVMSDEYWKTLNNFEGLSLLQDSLEENIEVNDSEDETKDEKSLEQEEKEQIVVANVDYYLNIRQNNNEESEIIGKLYKNGVGTVIEQNDDWFKIKSGSVTGYVKGEYVYQGEEADKIAKKIGKRLAKVKTTTLKVRENPNEDATVLTLIGEQQIVSVNEEKNEWIKITFDGQKGYVAKDYVDVYTEYEYAESIEEERIRLEREEAERQAEIEKANQTINKQNVVKEQVTVRRPVVTKPQSKPVTPSYTQTSTSTADTNSGLGLRIANYALQFKGNPYVYGGTSLTNGADCSGFVMSVYKNFGISLPRTSGSQGASGTRISNIANARPGDLIAYSGHIGIYIGNKQIVHASSSRTGIIVSSVNYRPIKSIRRIVK